MGAGQKEFFNRRERRGRRESKNAKNQNEYLEFFLRIYLSLILLRVLCG
jgi:hypothetical protein